MNSQRVPCSSTSGKSQSHAISGALNDLFFQISVLMPTAPSLKSEQTVRTGNHSRNFQNLAQIKFVRAVSQVNLAGILISFYKCLTYETCTKSYVSHFDSITSLHLLKFSLLGTPAILPFLLPVFSSSSYWP